MAKKGLPPTPFQLPSFSLGDPSQDDLDFSFGGADEELPALHLTPPPDFSRRAASSAPLPPGSPLGLADPTKPPTFAQQPFTGKTFTPEPLTLPKGVVNTSTWSGHGTHITDGLDLNHGQKTAVDIMAHAGTAVAAPADGVVLRLGSAQGGESMYFKDTRGYVWWLGHIDGRYSLPAGTRVRAGQTLSRISSHHAAPHLHLDRTLSPSNEFG